METALEKGSKNVVEIIGGAYSGLIGTTEWNDTADKFVVEIQDREKRPLKTDVIKRELLVVKYFCECGKEIGKDEYAVGTRKCYGCIRDEARQKAEEKERNEYLAFYKECKKLDDSLEIIIPERDIPYMRKLASKKEYVYAKPGRNGSSRWSHGDIKTVNFFDSDYSYHHKKGWTLLSKADYAKTVKKMQDMSNAVADKISAEDAHKQVKESHSKEIARIIFTIDKDAKVMFNKYNETVELNIALDDKPVEDYYRKKYEIRFDIIEYKEQPVKKYYTVDFNSSYNHLGAERFNKIFTMISTWKEYKIEDLSKHADDTYNIKFVSRYLTAEQLSEFVKLVLSFRFVK